MGETLKEVKRHHKEEIRATNRRVTETSVDVQYKGRSIMTCTGNFMYMSRCILHVKVYSTCQGVFYMSRCILHVKVYSTCQGVFYMSRCILHVKVYSRD